MAAVEGIGMLTKSFTAHPPPQTHTHTSCPGIPSIQRYSHVSKVGVKLGGIASNRSQRFTSAFFTQLLLSVSMSTAKSITSTSFRNDIG